MGSSPGHNQASPSNGVRLRVAAFKGHGHSTGVGAGRGATIPWGCNVHRQYQYRQMGSAHNKAHLQYHRHWVNTGHHGLITKTARCGHVIAIENTGTYTGHS